MAAKLIEANLGTALGFVKSNGEIITNPDFLKPTEAEALLVMVGEETPTAEDMAKAIGVA